MSIQECALYGELVLYLRDYAAELLLAQIQAFPYQNIALDWLSRPAESAALLVEAAEHEILPDDDEPLARFHHHRDFVFALSRLVPTGAQIWLQGWLDTVGHGSLTRSVRDDVENHEDPFRD